ncbi:MAG: glycogen debranching N-terminal domain-containing protein [Variibacter sp.]
MSTEAVSRADNLIEETPFYIPATTDSVTRPRRTLKHGDCFAILDSHGDIGASSGAPDGIYFHDTRFLSRLELLLNGFHPLLLGSNLSDDNSVLTIDLTNPDVYFDKRLVLPKDTVHIVRTIFLWRGVAYQRLSLRNHGERAVSFNLTLAFGSDFADLFEVRGMRRERRGSMAEPAISGSDVRLSYEGLDKRERQMRLFFDPAPEQINASAASFRLQLAPHESRTMFLTVACDAPEFVPISFNRSLLGFNRDRRRVSLGVGTVTTSNALFNEVLNRSMSDLYMLMTETPDGPYPYAGTPYYSTTFGRDGLITAMQMLWFDPKVAAGVLRRLARLQAKSDNAMSDAQPGKILHEMRGGEMAALGEVPFALYYGSVDSTPLFVMLAGLYARRTGDWELIETLWPHIEAALAWIDGPADPDGDSFVEYARATEQGLANQGWKDSFDAVFHADGTLAQGPVALSEVQGYVFAAKRLAAMCARRLGHEVRAAELETSAAQLAQKFEDAFWCPELDTYAIALDGKKAPCKVRTSNAGQVLFTGIAGSDHARKVGRGLLSPAFFSGWGIRTVAREAARYNPMSYHNGSIWPHDNALIAAGLARYGMKAEVEQVFQGLFDAATYMDLRRLPELFCGFKRRAGAGPTLYPVACAPQAWASGTPFMLLEAVLGLEFDPDAREIRLRNPRLPAFLPQVTLHNLRLGEAKITLALQRQGEGVSMQVLHVEGAIRVNMILD